MKIPEIKISVKYKGAANADLTVIRSSKDMYELLRTLFNADTVYWQEEMILLCLNQGNKVIGWYRVSHGGTTGTVCDPKIVFTIALNCAGTTIIIMAHNHPSGNLKSSRADDELTNKIQQGGKMLDIKLLDHIIYTPEAYFSYSDEGILC